MQIIRDPAQINQICDTQLRDWLTQRMGDMLAEGEIYDPDTYGWFVVLQEGDDLDALADWDCPHPLQSFGASGEPGDPAFVPSFNWIQDWPGHYEIVTVLSDGGEFVSVILPKPGNGFPKLLALCRRYASSEPGEL